VLAPVIAVMVIVIVILVLVIVAIIAVYYVKRFRKRGAFYPNAARPSSRTSKDYWFGEEEKIVSKVVLLSSS